MIVIYAIVSRDVLLKHLRYRDFWEKSKYQGLLTFLIRYKVLKREGNLSLLALASVNISQDILFCVGFIKHLKLNRTWMRSDNALLMPVSPMLILTSRICPRFIFPSFPYFLHVTQSRVSMWLTVSHRSVKKAEPLVVEKINLTKSFLPTLR